MAVVLVLCGSWVCVGFVCLCKWDGGMPILVMYESIRGLHVLIHALLVWWSFASDIQLSPSMSTRSLSYVVTWPPLRCIGLSGILLRLLLLKFSFMSVHHLRLRRWFVSSVGFLLSASLLCVILWLCLRISSIVR